MKFVWIGNDPWSSAFVDALLRRRDARLLAYIPVESDTLPALPAGVPILARLEDVSAVSDAEFWVLGGDLAGRADRLKYILRLDPIDLVLSMPLADKPDIYYELSLVQSETRIRVLPLAPEADHPAIDRVGELLLERKLGGVRWLEWTQPVGDGEKGAYRFLGGWGWVRELLGEIETISATGSSPEADRARQVVATGRARTDLVVTARWLAGGPTRLEIQADEGLVRCDFPEGVAGPVRVELGDDRVETIAVDPPATRWLARWDKMRLAEEDLEPWRAATRSIELAEAVERSLQKGRAVDLTYDEVTEEASFKSVMTMIGCSLVWLTLLVAILAAAGVPYVGYLVLPALVVFVLLQSLRRVARRQSRAPDAEEPQASF